MYGNSEAQLTKNNASHESLDYEVGWLPREENQLANS